MPHVDGGEHPRVLDQVADTVAAECVNPPDAEVLCDVEVVFGQDVVAFGRVALEVPHEKEDRSSVLLATVDLVVDEMSDALLVDDHLRREVDRRDLPYLLAVEFMDQVVGNEFPDMPDAGQPLDQDRGVDVVVSQKGYCDVFHLRTALL